MNKLVYIALAAALTATPALAWHKATLIDVTGNADTWADAISADGTIAGEYGPSGQRAAFIRHPDGSVETFAYDGAESTRPHAVNDSGQVVGIVYGQALGQHGFLRRPDGSLALVDFPGADNTALVAINASGAAAGSYYNTQGNQRSFVRDPDGKFHSFAVPGARRNTQAVGINDSGTVVGTCEMHNHVHGFVRDAQGHVAIFDPPDVKNTTLPVAITADGTVAGYYGDTAGRGLGFVRHPDGSFEILSADGALATAARGINDKHVVVGEYYDADHRHHAFMRKPDGLIKLIDMKRRHGDDAETDPVAINNSGFVIGDFTRFKDDTPVADYGFLRQP